MAIIHPEEKFQVAVIVRHALDNPGTLYKVEFTDGESYLCEFDASYESDNSGELGIEMDDPQYDEFHQVAFEIIETVREGKRRYNQYLTVDYRDFPSKITDVDTGVIVYPEA